MSQFLRSILCPSSTRKRHQSGSSLVWTTQASIVSSLDSTFTKSLSAIMTSRYTSRGVRACEDDSISPRPPDKESLSDRPLGWDTNHGWYINNASDFYIFGMRPRFPSRHYRARDLRWTSFRRFDRTSRINFIIWCDTRDCVLWNSARIPFIHRNTKIKSG